jgi:hypothetical protein
VGQIIIKLRANRETGKKDIVIEYESDEDMTGWEHEKRHKRVLEELIGAGVLEEGEFGQVVREKAPATGRAEPASPAGEAEPEAEKQGS